MDREGYILETACTKNLMGSDIAWMGNTDTKARVRKKTGWMEVVVQSDQREQERRR